jgi:DNA-binding beta-propeller fold protein YncE
VERGPSRWAVANRALAGTASTIAAVPDWENDPTPRRITDLGAPGTPVTLREVGRILLPSHPAKGGFDHAAVYAAGSTLYVAHTTNDSVDVIDLRTHQYVRSLPTLTGVAGVWVVEESGLLITSNRGENTSSVFRLPEETELLRSPTGERPNGLAFDAARQHLLVAGVGDRDSGAPPTASLIDVAHGRALHRLVLPGRTRWATYHRATDAFYVNIADPPRIAQIDGGNLSAARRLIEVPATGPHGLEQAPDGRTLYCACDDGCLVTVELPSGKAREVTRLAGTPDVLWLNPGLGHLYAAIGDPGVLQVISTRRLTILATIATGPGAHTFTLDAARNQLHVFLPESHEDLVLQDA